MASPDLTARPPGSLQRSSAERSRITAAFESPFSLLPSSPSSPVVASAVPNAIVNTSGVPASPPPLVVSASPPPQFHASSTPFLPPSRLMHTARWPDPQDSSGKMPPQPPGSPLQPLTGASLPSASVALTPPFPSLHSYAEPSSVGGSADSNIRQDRSHERHTFRKGKAEVSKLDFDLLDFSSPKPSTALAQGNLLEFSPQNILSSIPDQRAALETSDVMSHGMFGKLSHSVYVEVLIVAC